MYKTVPARKSTYQRNSRSSKNVFAKRITTVTIKAIISLLIYFGLMLAKDINNPIFTTIKKVVKYDISAHDIISKFNTIYSWSKQIELKNIGQVGKSYCYIPSFHEYSNNLNKIDNNSGAGNIDYSELRVQDTNKPVDIKCSPTPPVTVHTVQDNSNKTKSLDNSKKSSRNNTIAPIDGKISISSGFGERVHPIKKTLDFHKGIDIRANVGDNIRAVSNGTVIEATNEKTYGNFIRIEHNNKIQTIYAHCSKILVRPGQKVSKGDLIAKVGATGAVLGPHLHFEVLDNYKHIDPMNYLKDKI